MSSRMIESKMLRFKTKDLIEILPAIEQCAPKLAKILSQTSFSLSLKFVLPMIFDLFNVSTEKDFCARFKEEQAIATHLLASFEVREEKWLDALLSHNGI